MSNVNMDPGILLMDCVHYMSTGPGPSRRLDKGLRNTALEGWFSDVDPWARRTGYHYGDARSLLMRFRVRELIAYPSTDWYKIWLEGKEQRYDDEVKWRLWRRRRFIKSEILSPEELDLILINRRILAPGYRHERRIRQHIRNEKRAPVRSDDNSYLLKVVAMLRRHGQPVTEENCARFMRNRT